MKRTKLSKEQVIIQSLRGIDLTIRDISKKTGLSQSTISKQLSFKSKELSEKSARKINKFIKEVRKSKTKSNKALIKQVDLVAEQLLGKNRAQVKKQREKIFI